MKTLLFALTTFAAIGFVSAEFAAAQDAKEPGGKKDEATKGKEKADPSALAEKVYPAAIIPFEERSPQVKDLGLQVSDLLFAELVADPSLFLVDRAEFYKTIAEQSLAVSGAVKPGEAAQVGQLTGARILITGSVLQVDKKIFLVAKVMGTETSRVVGASVNGKASDELAPLVAALAKQVSTTIAENAEKLVAKRVEPRDRVAVLAKQLGKGPRPTVRVEVLERHVAQLTIDPAAETEIQFVCRELGFEVVDTKEGTVGAADILIKGEGFSELAGRVGGLVSVKSRLELKIVDRKSGKVLVSDRQTTVAVDASEQIAGKSALQEAAAVLMERMLPKAFGPEKK